MSGLLGEKKERYPEKIWERDDGQEYEVGMFGVSKIALYHEMGGLGPELWVRIEFIDGDRIYSRASDYQILMRKGS